MGNVDLPMPIIDQSGFAFSKPIPPYTVLLMTQIHGHEVLQMMMTSGKAYTKPGLTQDIISKFGPEARFFTCSAENMTAAELVEFLDRKGKLVSEAGGLQTKPELLCKH